jgi:hypothetical protein
MWLTTSWVFTTAPDCIQHWGICHPTLSSVNRQNNNLLMCPKKLDHHNVGAFAQTAAPGAAPAKAATVAPAAAPAKANAVAEKKAAAKKAKIDAKPAAKNEEAKK